ncbi:cation:proton antiporter [Erythrobacter litoralis]|uniref:Na+/H+ antiporter, CPA1 family protein n=1 Tax=Erythrobacter litoralis (strain HTCC2594) TaxID=314225 RepID=Q2NDC6_ERYLH|nr:sodium:proton antiporter [Erythrobacter litoralis]ABC62315.1 Na+/H+ antiporter, CPA1 family protein [Erythrobacter litoralis HTCC2594]
MLDLDPRIIILALFGLGLILSVGLERWLSDRYLSLPIIYVGLGYAAFALPLGLPSIDPTADAFDAITLEYVTEFIVIASLAGAGIAIDRPVTWQNWRQIWPLLAIAMPITIVGVAMLGWWGLGLAPASAILLGACLAPTDPVLARSVQVGPPGENQRHDVRFSLTVEAGLNDGLAFPFTYLAIAAVGMTALGGWTLEWFALDVGWRIFAGIAVGYAVGRAGAWYVFERDIDNIAETEAEEDDDAPLKYSTSEGLIVLGTLLTAYGLAEIVEGYGFLAVFVGAVTARQRENASRYHKISHHFIDQIEKIVLVGVLFAFGGMLASGVLSALTWPGVLIGLALIFVIRPIGGLISEAFCDLPLPGRVAIAFLGIRGMGSIYYLAYGQNNADFAQIDVLWAVVSFTILASIVIHGVSSAGLMRWIEIRKAHVHRGQEHTMDCLTPDQKRIAVEGRVDQ